MAEMPDVVHGTLSPGGDPATLIILKFKFLSEANGRRFKSAHITVTFLDPDANSDHFAPAVQKIAPDGEFSLLPSKESIEVIESAGLSSITVPPGVTIGVGMQYQWKKTEEEDSFAKVSSTSMVLGRDRGPANAVTWALLENPKTESGIPTFLQGAILLKRNQAPDKAGEKFQATVEIKVGVDWIISLKSIITQTPVVFNPALEAKSKKWMKDDLDKEDLTALQKIITSMPVN
jgi:hypothetical protein